MLDKIGFEKMLDNILNNAMKYSDKESHIEVVLKDTMLTIQDYGVGMNALALKNIYNRYYQSSNSNRGDGIGLALVRAYCRDEKIEIKIASEEGKGTMVCLNLSQILTL
jgi:two-component system OmpR family sensor kinase